ncbi:MAG: hypothetical protein ABR555_17605, partial [Pyrinomonadaceae bacterium]
IMSYLQTLFSFFNVPMFVVFVVGMFWKRASARSGFWGLLTGTVAAMVKAAALTIFEGRIVINFSSLLQRVSCKSRFVGTDWMSLLQ